MATNPQGTMANGQVGQGYGGYNYNSQHAPGYTGQSPFGSQVQNWLWGQAQGGMPSGMQDVLNQSRNLTSTPFMQQLGITPGQVGQYAMNQITGKGADAEQAAMRGNMMGDVNRTFTDAYNKGRQQLAQSGERGSSFNAKANAEGLNQLAGARSGVEQNAQQYGDQLRQMMYGRGMGALQGLQGAEQGDWQKQLQGAQTALQSLNPQMQWGGMQQNIGQNLLGYDANQQGQGNQWNQQIWNALHNSNQGGGFAGFAGNLLGQATPYLMKAAMGGA